MRGEKIRDHVNKLVDDGAYTDFIKDYKKLLVKYPEHRTIEEGEEAFDYEQGEYEEAYEELHESPGKKDEPAPKLLEAMGITKAALEMCEKCDLVEEPVETSTAVGDMLPPVDETVALGCYSFPVESSGGASGSADPVAESSNGPANSTDTSPVASAEASLWQDQDEQRMTALQHCMAALTAAGGDPTSETQLMRRINALVSKKQAAQAIMPITRERRQWYGMQNKRPVEKQLSTEDINWKHRGSSSKKKHLL